MLRPIMSHGPSSVTPSINTKAVARRGEAKENQEHHPIDDPLMKTCRKVKVPPCVSTSGKNAQARHDLRAILGPVCEFLEVAKNHQPDRASVFKTTSSLPPPYIPNDVCNVLCCIDGLGQFPKKARILRFVFIVVIRHEHTACCSTQTAGAILRLALANR